MRIILTQMEIEEAVEKLVLDQVNVPDDMRIDIDLKATRGEEGYQAFIDIVAHDAPQDGTDRSIDARVEPVKGAENLGIAEKVLEAKAQAQMPRRRGRPAGARNKPKDEVVETKTQEAAKPQPEKPEAKTNDEVIEAPAPGGPIVTPVAAETADQDPPSSSSTTEVTLDPEPEPKTETTETEAAPEPALDPVQEAQESTVEAETVDDTGPAPELPDEASSATQTVIETEAETQVEETPAPIPNVSDIPETDQVVEPNPEPATETQEAVVEEAPKAPVRSLFANLNRPTNQAVQPVGGTKAPFGNADS